MAEKNEIMGLDFSEVETIQYIVVNIGGEHYGLDIKYVDNIVRMQRITRVPNSQPYFMGIINLRGEIVPVMSIRRKMGFEDDEFTNASRIIILKIEEQGLLGVIFDAVREVVTLSVDSIEKPSDSNAKDSFINGIGKSNDELISIFDIDAIVEENR